MPVDWKQILTTGDIGALHQDASTFGHIYNLPADISKDTGDYEFDGSEAMGNVVKDGAGGAIASNLGRVYYKSSEAYWPYTSALNDTAGAKKLLGILVEDPNYFLLNGLAFVPHSSFDTSLGPIEPGSPLYLSIFEGLLTTVPPAESGQAIRLVGYVMNRVPEWDGNSVGITGDGALIFFSPSAVWLEQE